MTHTFFCKLKLSTNCKAFNKISQAIALLFKFGRFSLKLSVFQHLITVVNLGYMFFNITAVNLRYMFFF